MAHQGHTYAGLLHMKPASGRLADLARGSQGQVKAAMHGAFLTALCLRDVLDGETPTAAISKWCDHGCREHKAKQYCCTVTYCSQHAHI